MIKKLMLLAVMAMALAGFGASMAQGESGIQWRDHKAALGANAEVTFTGKTKVSNAVIGGVECSVLIKATLTAGTSTMDITEFEITETAGCVLNGLLKAECELVTGHSYTKLSNGATLSAANPWHGTGTKGGKIDISEVFIHYSFVPRAGHIHCPPTLTLESAVPTLGYLTTTLDKTETASTVSSAGQLTSRTDVDTGAVNTSGVLSMVAPKETYGLF